MIENEKTIHVEAFVREDLWSVVKSLVGKNYVWFITTPANYDYIKSYFNLKVSKEKFTWEKLAEQTIKIYERLLK